MAHLHFEEFYLQKWGILVATLSNFIMQQIVFKITPPLDYASKVPAQYLEPLMSINLLARLILHRMAILERLKL